MAVNTRDTVYQLRQGQLVALADETGWSIAADPVNDDAVRQLLTVMATAPAGSRPTVLIPNTDMLGLYVARVPDIAFDLVEFAENPLTVVYQQGKNLSPVLLDQQPEVAVRRSLNADVQRLLGSLGRGLLIIPFEAQALPLVAEGLVNNRFGTPPATLTKPRILRLGLGGEVEFLRK
ncbi:hypothetical protein BN8_01251 [Fibrisoma limi BUZ 3]|uniref:YrdC-like domain-containing protein n=1 Tax=Fibrisoma limi BUZ 3 TaxID=1185876 RepID=I2GEE0_9BACT|nr:Sua5/YciO/YrdC/YwlC family protein [Fibrisoma limi]CCH52265.1 hypothetical protein BN8_01251 [Fibrisoma limi BUZ 3]